MMETKLLAFLPDIELLSCQKNSSMIEGIGTIDIVAMLHAVLNLKILCEVEIGTYIGCMLNK